MAPLTSLDAETSDHIAYELSGWAASILVQGSIVRGPRLQ
jgi:hypothetical protein